MTPTDAPPFDAVTEEIPGFLFIDHVAIAVPPGTLDAQVAAYGLMGFNEIHREEIEGADHVREAMLQIGDSPNLIQLVEPMTANSPIQKAIDRNGGKGGLNHIGFRVRNAQAAFDALSRNGFMMIDPAPRPGSRGTTVFFMHPKGPPQSPVNILIEIVEE